jgi:aspartyl-tRNA(Asn)/glutamyl-tRNA(Gln) amidotransferase subunit B
MKKTTTNNLQSTTYVPVIGLEVHVELKTASKMFCRCDASYFGKEPNTHTCPVCLGLPGALPVPNKKAIEWCMMIALALNCKINEVSKFDRKNYYYPDLAKGYQISQYDEPFGEYGYIMVKSSPDAKVADKKIGVRRVHMEEDTAKLTHTVEQRAEGKEHREERISLIDFNRSGVPLVEIVTEPDFENAFQVTEYLKKLQQIVRYLDVSNADMEKGDMRLEPNISLRELKTPIRSAQGEQNSKLKADKEFELPKYKVEVKNINSFRFVAQAIEVELTRQQEILDRGETPTQETRGWNEAKKTTISQRVKEEANDYRYFPDPDIPPIHTDKSQIEKLKSQIPELPDAKMERFQKEFGLSEYDAEILTRERGLADFFEQAVRDGAKEKITPKQIANYIINKKVDIVTSEPAGVVKTILSSTQTAQVDESELQKAIEKVLSENQKAVEDYKNGKETVIMFLLGQVMRTIGKKVDAQLVKEKILSSIK